MNWSLTLDTAPSVEPLATAAYKAQMRVDHSDDDALIDAYALAARQLVELMTNRSLIDTTWKLRFDRFPSARIFDSFATSGGVILLPKGPLRDGTSFAIEYVDAAGATQTLATTEYRVDRFSRPPRVTPEYSKLWPVTREVTNAVTLTFVAGFGASGAAVPGPLLQALKLLVATWYQHRETVSQKKLEDLPRPAAFSSLIAPYTMEVAL